MMDKSGIASYSVGTVTAVGAAIVEQWNPMDWLTAIGVIVGVIGVIVRMYKDIAAHMDRRREEE
ncbi:hypothetical protein ACQ96U_23995 [Zooshikella sp. RANM57]